MAHGVLNAIMRPHVMRFNADAVPDAMSAIAAAMRVDLHPALPQRGREMDAYLNQARAPSAASQAAALVATLPVPHRLRDAGVPEAVLDAVAAEAATNATVQANPKPVTEADLRVLLTRAW